MTILENCKNLQELAKEMEENEVKLNKQWNEHFKGTKLADDFPRMPVEIY